MGVRGGGNQREFTREELKKLNLRIERQQGQIQW